MGQQRFYARNPQQLEDQLDSHRRWARTLVETEPRLWRDLEIDGREGWALVAEEMARGLADQVAAMAWEHRLPLSK